MIAIVLLDLGDVVARWDPSPRLAEYARRSGLTVDEVRRRLAQDDFWVDTDRGVYSGDEMYAQICARLGVAFTRDELLALQALAFRPQPEVLRIAEQLAARLRVGILTNNAPLLREAVSRHFPELERIFAPILYSFEFGHAKPARELFDAVARALALVPRQIFFADDQASHVAGARAAGWDAVRFESAAQLRVALVERGLVARAPAHADPAGDVQKEPST
ncbi:MAG: HAD family phosphatase [Myxococcota bacterium]